MRKAIEGIVLSVQPFEEKTELVTLFSKEYGKVILASKAWQKKGAKNTSALLFVEATITPCEKEIWKCHGFEIITSYPKLRTSFSVLKHASRLISFLHFYLPLHAETKKIYNGTVEFLETIPLFSHPHVALTAFFAKLAAIEGFLSNDAPLSKDELKVLAEYVKKPLQALKNHTCDKTLVEKLVILLNR